MLYKRNKETQFIFHQFLKYTTYNLKKKTIFFKNFKNIYSLKKIQKHLGGHGPLAPKMIH